MTRAKFENAKNNNDVDRGLVNSVADLESA